MSLIDAAAEILLKSPRNTRPTGATLALVLALYGLSGSGSSGFLVFLVSSGSLSLHRAVPPTCTIWSWNGRFSSEIFWESCWF